MAGLAANRVQPSRYKFFIYFLVSLEIFYSLLNSLFESHSYHPCTSFYVRIVYCYVCVYCYACKMCVYMYICMRVYVVTLVLSTLRANELLPFLLQSLRATFFFSPAIYLPRVFSLSRPPLDNYIHIYLRRIYYIYISCT